MQNQSSNARRVRQGSFDKASFHEFVDLQCERRLYFLLGEGDPRWLKEPEQLRLRLRNFDRRQDARELLKERGKRYERSVYQHLISTAKQHCKFQESPHAHERLEEVKLTPERARDLYQEQREHPELTLLLEHSFTVAPAFVSQLFALPQSSIPPTLDDQKTRSARPDIILVGPREGDDFYEITADGKRRLLTEPERLSRVGINLWDIKSVSVERLSNGYLVELLYYAHALAFWLASEGLSELFYVRCEGHAIFGQISSSSSRYSIQLNELSLDDISPIQPSRKLSEVIGALRWLDSVALYQSTLSVAQRLWREAQTHQDIYCVPTRLQARCGQCPLIDDCVASHKRAHTETEAGMWNLELIPFMSPTISAQLKERGLLSIHDVADRLDELELGDVPSPLHAVLPLLKLRAEALRDQEVKRPTRQLLSHLPPHLNMALTLDLEGEQIQGLIFGASLHFETFPPRAVSGGLTQLELDKAFRAWWTALLKDQSLPSVELLYQHLTPEARAHLVSGEVTPLAIHETQLPSRHEAGRTYDVLEEAIACAGRLRELQGQGLKVEFVLQSSEPYEGETVKVLRLSYTYLSGNTSTEQELELLCTLAEVLSEIVKLAFCTEEVSVLTAHEFRDNKKKFYSLSQFAAFYWSGEQIKHIRDLLERHLYELYSRREVDRALHYLIEVLAPSESGLSSRDLPKRAYDLRALIEGAFGFPQLINLSWHESLKQLCDPNLKVNDDYWAPHFNFMDFAPWYALCKEQNSHVRRRLENELSEQLELKGLGVMRLLHAVRRASHAQALRLEEGIYSDTREAKKRYNQGALLRVLPHAWVKYHGLQTVAQELATVEARHAWPDVSIAKLTAAQVSSWSQKGDELQLCIKALSSHMKLKEKSNYYVISDHERGWPEWRLRGSVYTLKDLSWSAKLGGNLLSLKAFGFKGARTFKPNAQLFIFPESSDYWGKRLEENLNVSLHDPSKVTLGTSWLADLPLLGHPHAQRPTLVSPQNLKVSAQELYLYAPRLLPPPSPALSEGPLKSTIRYAPDSSQQEGIKLALSQLVSCLQGPPGTGKSQTIVALIDEFFMRREGRPTRVLVTSFTHQAQHVVMEKIYASRGGEGASPDPNVLSLVASAPLVALSSSASGGFPAPTHPQQEPVLELYKNENNQLMLCETAGETAGSMQVKQTPIFETILTLARRCEMGEEPSAVYFANAHMLSKIIRMKTLKKSAFFDMIIVDEASQLPVDALSSLIHYLKPCEATLSAERDKPIRHVSQLSLTLKTPADELSHLVLVGDLNQLPPVRQVEPPKSLEPFVGSAFSYFMEALGVQSHQLRVNYRSHPTIVRCIRQLNLYESLEAFYGGEGRDVGPLFPKGALPLSEAPWLEALFEEGCVLSSLTHHSQWDTLLSPTEAEIVAQIALSFYRRSQLESADEERTFWAEGLGVVSPHNAHGALIIKAIYQALISSEESHLEPSELMSALKSSVASVDKFQGSARRFIIASYGVSSRDQLSSEESFIYDINRFNVLISRAQQKMLLVCSKALLDYIPSDRSISAVASRIKEYALTLCEQPQEVVIEPLLSVAATSFDVTLRRTLA